MVLEIPVYVEQDLIEFVHNEPNNVVTQHVIQYQDFFRNWAQCIEQNLYRSMKLLPVEFLMNSRYIFAKLNRRNDVLKSIEKIIVLDEFKNPIDTNSVFLSVNDTQKIVMSENNLIDMNLPMIELPFSSLAVGIDIDGFGHNPKYLYLETVEVFQAVDIPNNVFGIPVQNCRLSAQPGQIVWIDDSLLFSVLPYTEKYQLPSYEAEIRTDADFDMGLELQGFVIHGLAREFDIIPKARWCTRTIQTDQEFSFLIFPDVDIREDRIVNICGKTVIVNNGFIGFSLEDFSE